MTSGQREDKVYHRAMTPCNQCASTSPVTHTPDYPLNMSLFVEPKTTTDTPADWKKNSEALGFARFKNYSRHYNLKFGSTFL